jgi:HD-GYP domain-containing protein (c-di-GMP phosphodiesterase class II)
MDKLRAYITKNFEQFFVLAILLFTAAINHVIDQKLAFLNFYFLPIILAGYYLGTRKSVFGSVFCTLLVAAYAILDPSKFQVTYSEYDMFLHLVVWSSFLLLAGAVVGKQHEKLTKSVGGILKLNRTLQEKQAALNDANETLKDYSSDLESKVTARTVELEKSKETLEGLKAKVENTLYSTMDASVAKLIIEGRLRSDKRKISVMFSDLAGFTSYSEDRSPEAVVKDLNEYLNAMEPILLDYRGHIDKYLGDGIMAEFGAPIDYENYRLLAVITAIKMQEKMKEMDWPWKMRIGIASGAAITGLIGSKRQAYTSIGDVVNVASRLETQCPEGGFLIDDFTYQGAERFIEVEPFHLSGEESEEDRAKRIKIDKFQDILKRTNNSLETASICKKISDLYIELLEMDDAYKMIEKAVRANPDEPMYKVAMAELVMSRDQKGQISVKGRKKTVKTYRVLGIIDVLQSDTDRIPSALYNKFKSDLNSIAIPESFSLKVEALDGSIGHARTVALLSYAIASRINEYDKENHDILIAAYAADFGKEIIPHNILNRKGSLSQTEMTDVQKHPLESARIMQMLGYQSESVLNIIRHSHERLNGTGYPMGVSGKDIPLGSKIIAVADAYSALTAWRPYREKWEKSSALDEINKGVELGWYDASVVEALKNILNDEKQQKMPTSIPDVAS